MFLERLAEVLRQARDEQLETSRDIPGYGRISRTFDPISDSIMGPKERVRYEWFKV